MGVCCLFVCIFDKYYNSLSSSFLSQCILIVQFVGLNEPSFLVRLCNNRAWGVTMYRLATRFVLRISVLDPTVRYVPLFALPEHICELVMTLVWIVWIRERSVCCGLSWVSSVLPAPNGWEGDMDHSLTWTCRSPWSMFAFPENLMLLLVCICLVPRLASPSPSSFPGIPQWAGILVGTLIFLFTTSWMYSIRWGSSQ